MTVNHQAPPLNSMKEIGTRKNGWNRITPLVTAHELLEIDTVNTADADALKTPAIPLITLDPSVGRLKNNEALYPFKIIDNIPL